MAWRESMVGRVCAEAGRQGVECEGRAPASKAQRRHPAEWGDTPAPSHSGVGREGLRFDGGLHAVYSNLKP